MLTRLYEHTAALEIVYAALSNFATGYAEFKEDPLFEKESYRYDLPMGVILYVGPKDGPNTLDVRVDANSIGKGVLDLDWSLAKNAFFGDVMDMMRKSRDEQLAGLSLVTMCESNHPQFREILTREGNKLIANLGVFGNCVYDLTSEPITSGYELDPATLKAKRVFLEIVLSHLGQHFVPMVETALDEALTKDAPVTIMNFQLTPTEPNVIMLVPNGEAGIELRMSIHGEKLEIELPRKLEQRNMLIGRLAWMIMDKYGANMFRTNDLYNQVFNAFKTMKNPCGQFTAMMNSPVVNFTMNPEILPLIAIPDTHVHITHQPRDSFFNEMGRHPDHNSPVQTCAPFNVQQPVVNAEQSCPNLIRATRKVSEAIIGSNIRHY